VTADWIYSMDRPQDHTGGQASTWRLSCSTTSSDANLPTLQELSYRKQIARQLHKHYKRIALLAQ